MGEDCCFVEVGVGLADDDRPSDLTPPFALHANDGYLANLIELIDDGFDLGRHTFSPPEIYMSFPTIDDMNVSLLVDLGNVAGLEVAVDEARFVCLGVLPVTGGDIRAACSDLADFAQDDVVAIVVHDARFGVEGRQVS
ncbi:MAG: hypothetical protein ACJAXA_000058 [Candidatus Aldehydirespiratoraceae bacterium]|jgi:hypothetical protein